MSILKAPQQSIVMGGSRGNCTGCAKRVIDTLTRSVRTWLRCYDRHNLRHETEQELVQIHKRDEASPGGCLATFAISMSGTDNSRNLCCDLAM